MDKLVLDLRWQTYRTTMFTDIKGSLRRALTIQHQTQRLNGDITGGQTEPIQDFTVIDCGSSLAAGSEWQPRYHAQIFFYTALSLN